MEFFAFEELRVKCSDIIHNFEILISDDLSFVMHSNRVEISFDILLSINDFLILNEMVYSDEQLGFEIISDDNILFTINGHFETPLSGDLNNNRSSVKLIGKLV